MVYTSINFKQENSYQSKRPSTRQTKTADKFKSHQNLITSRIHHNTHSYQVTHQFLIGGLSVFVQNTDMCADHKL